MIIKQKQGNPQTDLKQQKPSEQQLIKQKAPTTVIVSRPRKLKPQNQKKNEQAFSNFAFVSSNIYNQLLLENEKIQPVYVQINGFIYNLKDSNDYQDNEIALHKYARQIIKITLTDDLEIKLFKPPIDKEYRLSQLSLELEMIQQSSTSSDKKDKLELDDKEIEKQVKRVNISQFMHHGQMFLIEFMSCVMVAKVMTFKLLQIGQTAVDEQNMEQVSFGLIVDETDIDFTVKAQQPFKLKSSGQKAQNLFRPDFKFQDMGIGGLDTQLMDIFRRAFASRRFPSSVLKKYGISHVKGLLLFGPPGTGKTLIARQLAKCLRAKEPKIVNGPEVLSKYVGEAEENIRKLFADARSDYELYGEESQLHIIVFDEIDAICKQRGSMNSGTHVHDNVVNQLLSMIDGVDSLNNILVIGMTNRKDLLDEAVLRPGRFEVHIEVSLPNEQGRFEILSIHTAQMKKSDVLSKEVDLKKIATITNNYTGAELEAVVKSASSWAFNRVHNLMDFSKQNLDEEVVVEQKDFQKAVEEVRPQFGVDNDKFEILLRNDLIDYGTRFQKIQTLIQNSIQQTKTGKSSQLHSILLEGEVGTGKTAIAAWAALNCQFPYVKLISPENFVGYTESGKINSIVRVFDDAYRSKLACIVLDNIERLIEFIDIGPRFSNPILQALLVLIKKIPKDSENRLLIIGTTNQAKVLKDLEIVSCFNLVINIPTLDSPPEILKILNQGYNIQKGEEEKISNAIKNVPIKKLQMILDMVGIDNQVITHSSFIECYDSIHFSSL